MLPKKDSVSTFLESVAEQESSEKGSRLPVDGARAASRDERPRFDKDGALRLLSVLADGEPMPLSQLLSRTGLGIDSFFETIKTMQAMELIQVIGDGTEAAKLSDLGKGFVSLAHQHLR